MQHDMQSCVSDLSVLQVHNATAAHHLKHEPGNDFGSLPDVTRKEFVMLVSKVDHDGTRLKNRQILLIMVNCRTKMQWHSQYTSVKLGRLH